jgi:ADP-heptose:LPS heptosyltransferase
MNVPGWHTVKFVEDFFLVFFIDADAIILDADLDSFSKVFGADCNNRFSWPEEKMAKLMELIAAKNSVTFWLFGGLEDSEKLEKLQSVVKDSHNLAGKLTLEEELAQMSRLDLMIAMDSSNMHMAALAGTRVVSIWGGTDPITGFGAWMQPLMYSVRIQSEELPCRPCTVYGKGECKRNDFACMNRLTPEMVLSRIEKTLAGKNLNLKKY